VVNLTPLSLSAHFEERACERCEREDLLQGEEVPRDPVEDLVIVA
jgi:hypothetical protein